MEKILSRSLPERLRSLPIRRLRLAPSSRGSSGYLIYRVRPDLRLRGARQLPRGYSAQAGRVSELPSRRGGPGTRRHTASRLETLGPGLFASLLLLSVLYFGRSAHI